MKKKVKIELEATLENQGLARAFAAAYASEADPTVEEITEIKTAVSEAFSNAVIHGYPPSVNEEKNASEAHQIVTMELIMLCEDTLMIKISDEGIGIENVTEAMEPLFTTYDGEECSGMGFTVMESFTDKLTVDSEKGKGTTVTMIKKLDTYYGL